MEGLITKTLNRFYHVEVDRQSYLCSPKGAFKRASRAAYRLPVIGDRVRIALLEASPADQAQAGGSAGVEGYILEILPRDNMLERADQDGRNPRVMAANLSNIAVMSALVKPGLDFALIDRYLLAAELAGIEACLVINKIDMAAAGTVEKEEHLRVYRRLGVPVLAVSVKSGEGLEDLLRTFSRGITFLTGTSGVGKSSLVNRLVPGVDLAIGEVDPRGGRGRHTTSFSVLVGLPDGGHLVDSPGLRDFFPINVAPEEVRFGFREIASFQAECKFSSCMHDSEPGCAVRAAVEEETISQRRYKSYHFLLGEMLARAKRPY